MVNHDSPEFLNELGYEVIDHIGRGNYGSVYLAKMGGENLAVKVPTGIEAKLPDWPISKTIARHKQNTNHIRREYEAYVRLFGVDNVPGEANRTFIPANEFINGKYKDFSLDSTQNQGLFVLSREFITGKDLTPNKVITDFQSKRRLLKAVKNCHRAGVCKLDITRGNVIVTPKGMPYLIDFGYALFEQDLNPKDFEENCDEDFNNLKQLFGPEA